MIHIIAYHNEGFKPLADFVRPLWQEYADRHGYKLLVTWSDDVFERHYSFYKTWMVGNYLKHGGKDADAVLVIDLDMIPTNMTVKPKCFLADLPRVCDVAMAKDINGWNSGAYIIRPTEKALCWLDCIVELRLDLTSEQHAMWRINKPFDVAEINGINSIPYHEYPDYGKELDHYSQWRPGHFVAHFPGMTMERRLELLQRYKQHIIR